MSLIEYNDLVLKQIRVVDALTNENTVCYVSEFCLFVGVIIKSYRVPDLLSNLARSFI